MFKNKIRSISKCNLKWTECDLRKFWSENSWYVSKILEIILLWIELMREFLICIWFECDMFISEINYSHADKKRWIEVDSYIFIRLFDSVWSCCYFNEFSLFFFLLNSFLFYRPYKNVKKMARVLNAMHVYAFIKV